MTAKEWRDNAPRLIDNALKSGLASKLVMDLIDDLVLSESEWYELDTLWRDNHRRQLHRSELAEAELVRCREALEEYGTHQPGCPAQPGWTRPAPCTCGLSELLTPSTAKETIADAKAKMGRPEYGGADPKETI